MGLYKEAYGYRLNRNYRTTHSFTLSIRQIDTLVCVGGEGGRDSQRGEREIDGLINQSYLVGEDSVTCIMIMSTIHSLENQQSRQVRSDVPISLRIHSKMQSFTVRSLTY